MKIIKSLLCLLLIPFALAFMSCNNEIPEELIIEVDPESQGPYELDDVDYFELGLYKLSEDDEYPDNNSNYNEGTPPLFEVRLNKGDVLRLGNLEPGLYQLYGAAYKYFDYGDGEFLAQEIGSVYGKSEKEESVEYYDSMMREWVTVSYIVIDEFSPTVVKLVVYLHGI